VVFKVFDLGSKIGCEEPIGLGKVPAIEESSICRERRWMGSFKNEMVGGGLVLGTICPMVLGTLTP